MGSFAKQGEETINKTSRESLKFRLYRDSIQKPICYESLCTSLQIRDICCTYCTDAIQFWLINWLEQWLEIFWITTICVYAVQFSMYIYEFDLLLPLKLWLIMFIMCHTQNWIDFHSSAARVWNSKGVSNLTNLRAIPNEWLYTYYQIVYRNIGTGGINVNETWCKTKWKYFGSDSLKAENKVRMLIAMCQPFLF